MALQALWAPETQFQNKNGSLLVHGKIYVQYRGRSQLAKTYRDAEGTYLNTNPLLTDNDGRVLCYADDAFSYTAVVCDYYGNELFSFDPIPCGSGSGSGSSSGSSAQHWIGINGQTQQVSRNTYTRLKLPSGLDNVDYDGDFVLGTIKGSGTEMVLKDGLYLVNTVIRFKQSSDDLTNTLSNVIIHTRDFDLTNIQEVGAVVRDEAGPDASDDIHTITLTYIRHVSQDDVGSDRIKFAVETPNTWTECYIQNLQIAKLGSSVNGGGTAEPYDPGQYISIENGTISVTGIDPESYATHDELQSATSAFITSADFSSYATKTWVNEQHYITSADIPDIPDDVVTSAELAQTSGAIEQDIADLTSSISEALADKMDKSSSGDFYPRYDNPEGYLTSVPSEYVTESEMSGYVQDHTSGFITSADLPDVSDMATQTWVNEQHYITSADVPAQVEYSAGDNIDITNHVVSVTDTSLLLAGDNVSITPSGNDYIISAQIPETSGYVTEQEMEDAIQSATSAFITSSDLPDVSDMATKTWVTEQNYITSADIPPIPEDVVTFAELATVSGEIVNQIPSLDGYATEQYVQDYTAGFITSADVPEYSAGQYIDITNKTISVSPVKSLVAGDNVSITASGNDYIISAQVPGTSGYVTEHEMNEAIQSATSAFITSADIPDIPDDVVTSGELATVSGEIVNQIPSLDGYATETYVTEHTSAFVTSADLPDVSDMATETWVSGQGYLKNLFQAEYGVTKFSDILEAVYNKKTVYCLIPASLGHPSGRMAFLAYVNVSDPIAASNFFEFQYYRSNSTEYANDSVFVYQIKPNNVWTTTERVAGNVSDWNARSGRAQILHKPDLSIYATKSGMEEYVTEQTSAFITSEDLPDVSDMATKTWVGEQGYLTSIPSEYVTDTELAAELSGKADTSAIPDVSNFVTQEDIDAAVSGKMDATESSAFYPMATNPSGYLVSSDLNGYATESYVDSAVSGKQDTLTFGYDSSDKINAINGSAIAGGGGGGGSYTAGEFIDITNDVISIPSSSATNLIGGDGILITESAGNSIISLGLNARITDVQYVAELPAVTVSSVLYLIPEA